MGENKERFYEDRIDQYKTNRQNALEGKINAIPSPFKRFRKEFPGIEQGMYYLITGNEKAGKSQVSDYLFFLHPLMYAYHNPDKLKVKVLYFSLEMSQADKFDQLTCHWLFRHTQGRIRVNTKDLKSLDSENPLSQEVLDLLESKEYRDFFDFLEDNLFFYETIGHPTGIYTECKRFAEARGTYTYKEMDWTDNQTKKVSKKQVIDKFHKNNPDEYWIVITDHLSLITTEGGRDLRESIGLLSSNYNVRMRNLYGFTIVNIQQQSATSQDNESFKLDRLAPHPGNLGDNKSTKNDLNVMLGIFSPARFKKTTWEGYDIRTFQDNIRFLEVVLNRSGSQGAVCPLYFDGAVNFFAELPLPHDTEGLQRYINMAQMAQAGYSMPPEQIEE